MRTPKNNLLKARFLAIAESCGDAMTFEHQSNRIKQQVLMRSVVKSRRKNIGQSNEYVNDDPELESFTLSLERHQHNIKDLVKSSEEVPILLPGEKIANSIVSSEENDDRNNDTEEASELDGEEEVSTMQDSEEFLPSEIDSTNDAESYQDIVETTDPNLQGATEFRKIVAHFWKDGTLFLKAQYIDTIQGSQIINTFFAKLRRDEPVPCAKYIR